MKKQHFFILALFITSFANGFEHTFLNTLIPEITYDLGGVEYFTWSVLAFTIGNLMLTPLTGRLANKYDKTYLFVAGNILMILGAVLSAFSQTMFQLIAFRFITGLGAGMNTVLSYILIGNVFSVKERIKWNALLGIVYSASTFLGPVVAGALSEYFTWRVIFFSPIIFFLTSNAFIIYSSREFLKTTSGKDKERIRIMNNIVLSVLITLTALLLSFSGVVIPLTSVWFYALLITTLIFGYWFYSLEKNASEGMFPYHYFKKRLFTTSIFISIGAGAGKLTILTFGPMFVMLSLSTSVEMAGYILTPLLVMTPLSAYVSGKLLMKLPFRFIIFGNTFSIAMGLLMFSHITPDSPYWFAILASIVSGLGAGTVSQMIIIIIQEKYPKSDLGILTSTFTFFRWIGNTLGVAIGTFSLMFFANRTFSINAIDKIDVTSLYQQVYDISNDAALINDWNHIFQQVFWVATIIVLISSLLALTLDKGRVTND